jgi:hypothetical protein
VAGVGMGSASLSVDAYRPRLNCPIHVGVLCCLIPLSYFLVQHSSNLMRLCCLPSQYESQHFLNSPPPPYVPKRIADSYSSISSWWLLV